MVEPIPVIIPVRNGLAYTRDCIASLREQNIKIDPWVIDNASTDGTTQWLRTNRVPATHHRPPLSVAASWNYALGCLFKTGAERVAVLNNDTLFRPDFIRALVEADLPFATGVGVATLEQMNEPWTRADRDHPDFSAYLIRRDCWERVGPFDEGYKGAYCEDAEYHLRAWRRGVHLTCIGIPFWHAASGTLKSASKVEADAIQATADANRKRFNDLYGVEVGSEGYTRLFNEGTFGWETRAAKVKA